MIKTQGLHIILSVFVLAIFCCVQIIPVLHTHENDDATCTSICIKDQVAVQKVVQKCTFCDYTYHVHFQKILPEAMLVIQHFAHLIQQFDDPELSIPLFAILDGQSNKGPPRLI